MKGFPTGVNYDGYTREFALSSIGEGWYGLINEAFDKLEKKYKNIKIIQVKEKWGGLRIYTDYANQEFDAFIIELETRSFTICEDCGKPGSLRKGGWYRTLCEQHAQGRDSIQP